MLHQLINELRTTETLTEGLIVLLVLGTMIPFTLTLVPVPSVLGVDPNAPIMQYGLTISASAAIWFSVVIRRVSGE